VVPIAYPGDFVKVMDVFRAVLAAGERSARALALTAQVIDHNAANYTAWQFRRACLQELGSDLRAELDFVQAVADDSPKNYQVWFHRRRIVELLGDASRELDFVRTVHEEDAKNYHAWSHLQWVAAAAPSGGDAGASFAAQLPYVEKLLEADVRNNSAWNHRWFLVHGANGKLGARPELLPVPEPLPADAARAEAGFAVEKLGVAFSNESPWLYLRALMREQRGGAGGADFADVVARVKEMAAATGNEENRHYLSFLLDLAEADLPPPAAADDTAVGAAVALVDKLMDVDETRRNYWARRRSRLVAMQGET